MNLNVIDAVQARIAAAAPGENESAEAYAVPASARRGRSLDNKRELFKNLRVETSLENVDNISGNDVECNIVLPQWKQMEQNQMKNGGGGGSSEDNQPTDGRRSSMDGMQKSSRTMRYLMFYLSLISHGQEVPRAHPGVG